MSSNTFSTPAVVSPSTAPRAVPLPIRFADREDYSRRLLQMPTPQQLRDLNGVQCRALAQIIRHAPEAEAVVDGRVLADAAHERRIFADAFDGSYIAAVLALIDQHHAWRLAQ